MTPSEHINSILDVNSSWREVYNEIGCLLAFDYDLGLEGSILVDVIMEDCEVTEEEAIHELTEFAYENGYVWDKETVRDNKDYVIETLNNNGGEGEEDYKDFMNE